MAEAIEKSRDNQFSLTAVEEQNAIARIRAADLNSMTPLDAMMLIKDIKERI